MWRNMAAINFHRELLGILFLILRRNKDLDGKQFVSE